ncbi:hypothetical protein, partial [Aeromonas sobria]|uniref:hypothetical protein n=1 Tax=Aeromonas sobria TaxID=646 RepID=UPI003F2FDFD4
LLENQTVGQPQNFSNRWSTRKIFQQLVNPIDLGSGAFASPAIDLGSRAFASPTVGQPQST